MKRNKQLIIGVLCIVMFSVMLISLAKEVSAEGNNILLNGSFEVGYVGMDVYGWHITAMSDELIDKIQQDENKKIQSVQAFTLKTEVETNRNKVAALTKYGKGTVAMTSQKFSITAGQTYRISYDCLLKELTGDNVPEIQVAVKQMAADGEEVAWTILKKDTTVAGDMVASDSVATTYPSNEWVTTAKTFIAHENASYAELYIKVSAADNVTGTILFDKLVVSDSTMEAGEDTSDQITLMLEGKDANGDGTKGDICDFVRVKKYLADKNNVITVTDADMNENEIVNEDDLALYRWKLLGVTTSIDAEKVGIRTKLSEELTKKAHPVIEMIYGCPSVDKLEGLSGSAILEARKAYTALDEGAKEKVKINYATLTALEASYQEKYQMLYDMSSTTAFKKNNDYGGQQYVTFTVGEDATYGKVLKATYNSQTVAENHLVIKYQKSSNLAEQLSGYAKVCFYLYNPGNADSYMLCDFGGSLIPKYTVLTAKAWTKVEVPVSDFISGSYFGVLNVGFQTGPQEFLFSAIWAEKDILATKAQPVIDMIDALPTIADVEGYHKVQIQEAREAYDALSEVVQSKVTNYATLTALETSYQEKYEMLYDMSNIDVFRKNTDYSGQQYVTFTSGADVTYGNVLKATYNSQTAAEHHLVIKYQKASNLAEQLSGYEKVCFYVYNPRNDDRNLLCDFGGSLIPKYTVLTAKAWTKVEVPVSDFISGSYFGVLNVGSQTGPQEFLFSAIWAESALKSAQPVIDMIDALPEADSVEMPAGIKYIETVNEAVTAYEALSETAKTYISDTNKAKLTAWQEKIAGYTVAANTSATMDFSAGTSFNTVEGTITAKKDAEYGSYYELNITGLGTTNNKTGTVFFTIKKNLTSYTNLYFYVYNPLNSNKTIGIYSGANFAGSAKIQPGWNLVTLDGTKVTDKNYMRVYFADTKEVAGTWKVTTVYGVK